MRHASHSMQKDRAALRDGAANPFRRPQPNPQEIARQAFQDTAKKIDAIFERREDPRKQIQKERA